MSIIIRLQNLPLSAKSGDIRRFFGGLRIPNGGVHIIGGENGDAYIAFNTDEDARLAMRKDGGKIDNTRVKLLLSSRMEMQHEIEQITKSKRSPRLSPDQRRRLSRSPRRSRERSIDKKEYTHKSYRSNVTSRGRTLQDVGRAYSPFSRSRSPRKRSRSPRRRSRSPRKTSGSRRSLSPFRQISRSPQRSASPRSVSQYRTLSRSPFGDRHDPFYGSGNERATGLYRHTDAPNHDYHNMKHLSENEVEMSSRRSNDLILQKEQKLLERRITEALNSGFDLMEKKDIFSHLSRGESSNNLQEPYSRPDQRSNLDPYRQDYMNPAFPERPVQDNSGLLLSSIAAASNISLNKNINVPRNFPPAAVDYSIPQNINRYNEGFPNMLPPAPMTAFPPPASMPPMTNMPPPGPISSMRPAGPITTMPPPGHITTMPPPHPISTIPPPLPMMMVPPPLPPVPQPSLATMTPSTLRNPCLDTSIPHPGHYITISGLDPAWNFNDVQIMLKGSFVPQNNIKWEIDDHGMKTGTAFIKLSNKDDFKQLLSCATYVFNNKLITVSECPDHVFHRYFLPEWPPNANVETYNGENCYYKMKGLPFLIKDPYQEIINFFRGIEVVDLYVEICNGKLSGIAYVGFGNPKDYREAFKMNSQKVGHRQVYLISSTRQAMMKSKERNGDLLTQSTVLSPSNGNLLSATNQAIPRRPLCVLLTGLPRGITPNKILTFFRDSGLKPDSVHVTINEKRKSDGRAFVEFSNLRDFDAALERHGDSIGGKMICVKQTLYDEMLQILSSRRARHCYNTPLGLTENMPEEKVPYLWQPPDENMDHSGRFPNKNFSPEQNYKQMSHPHDRNRSDFQIFEYGNQSSEPSAVSINMSNSNVPFNQESGFGTAQGLMQQQGNLDHFRNEFYQGKEWNSSDKFPGHLDWPPDSVHAPIGSDSYKKDPMPEITDKEDPSRNPVKFEVKIKQPVAKNTKADDAFDRSLKLDDKRKLSKLSPDRQLVAQQKPSTSAEKKEVYKSSENKPKSKNSEHAESSQKKDKKISPEAQFPTHADNKKRRMKRSRNLINIDVKHKQDRLNNRRSRSPRRPTSRGNSKPDTHDATEIEVIEPIVQMCNVDPSVGSREVKEFLCGFDIDPDQIIRRFGDYGEPTGDVRVTFANFRDAKNAVRILNGCYLNGMAVEMFIVNYM